MIVSLPSAQRGLRRLVVVLGAALVVTGHWLVPAPAAHAATVNSELDQEFGVTWGIGDWVGSIVPLIDGGYMVGGDLSSVNGSSVSHVVRLNSRGILDSSFSAKIDGSSVESILELAGGGYLIGGKFSEVNGHPVGNLARLDAQGNLDPTFNAVVEAGFSYKVSSMVEATDGGFLIAGNFRSVNGVPVGHVARLDAEGNLEAAFNNNLGTGLNGAVQSATRTPDWGYLLGGQALNSSGAPVHGAAVTFTIQGPTGTTFADGSITSLGITDSEGLAGSARVHAGDSGVVTVVATIQDGPSATFYLTVTGNVHLGLHPITGQPQ